MGFNSGFKGLNSKITFEVNVKICYKKISFSGSNDYKTNITKCP